MASELSHGCPGQGASNTAPGPHAISPAPPSAHRSVRGPLETQRPETKGKGALKAWSPPRLLPPGPARPLHLPDLCLQLSPPPRFLRLLAPSPSGIFVQSPLCSRSTCWRRPSALPGQVPPGGAPGRVRQGDWFLSPGRVGLLCPQHTLPATRPGVWEAGWGQARGNPGPHGGSGHSTPGHTPPQKDAEENTRAELHAPTAPPCGHRAPHEHAGSSL